MSRFAPVLAALALLSAACAADGDEATPTTGQTRPATGATPSSTAVSSPPTGGGPAEGVTFEQIPELVARVQPSTVSILRGDGGEGSGVIWSADGIVVTNYHVIEGLNEVTVAFADGQRVPGQVLATDPRTDLAIVQADRSGLPAATFADDLPRVGSLALAIGNPIGFENSVSQGVVSGLHRAIPGSAQVSAALVDLIQTDAAISPGNSGGALVGETGEVIGVNVAYIPPNSQAGAVSLGFAIPAPTVTDVVGQLLEDGTAEHAYLGIRPATLTPQLAQQLNVDAESGVAVLAVERGGPADRAGIQPGDVITAVDGFLVESAEDLLGALRGRAPGDEVTVTVRRGGEETDVDVMLGELPPVG